MRTKIFSRLASTELTLICMGLMMFLIFTGTLAQVHLGTYAAQKAYFDSVWIYAYMGDIKVPVFPGGYTVGALWLVNLTAAFVMRFRADSKKIGLYMSHSGLLLLLLGQFLTQTLTRESQMPIPVGETRNYSEDFRDTELVLIRSVDEASEEVISVPQSIFSQQRTISLPHNTLKLSLRAYYPNAVLAMATDTTAASMVTQGIGRQLTVHSIPVATTDDENNQPTVYVEIFDQGKSLGIWLLSSGLGAPQSFKANGHEYRVLIRSRRHYLPFSLTLKEFRHDRYPGTQIPKNFSSLVTLRDLEQGVERDTLIYMNNPLRYQGRTFYQASYGEGDQLSILQVVQNPVWLAPYIACSIMALGLGIHFIRRLYA